MKIISLTFVVLYKIRKRAIDQGFNSKIDFKILASYVQDILQFGQSEIFIKKYNEIIVKVT